MLDHESIVPAAEPGFLSRDSLPANLETRLERGWQLMLERESEGLPTDDLFGHFQDLLSDYEAACRNERNVQR